MTVWKIGSRWNATGARGDSVLGLFRRHGIVFVGSGQHLFQKIQPADLVAITDGVQAMAVGKVTSLPMPLTDIVPGFESDPEMEDFLYDGVLGCKVAVHDLRPEDCFDVFPAGSGKRGPVFRLPNCKDQVAGLYARYQRELVEEKRFSIEASSRTLSGGERPLLNAARRFRVPVYQRPYSWSEDQVRRFLSDLLRSFHGTDGNASSEPMFVGAMQIGAGKTVDESLGLREHDVIDGQQRLSTMLVLLKVLSARHATAAATAGRTLPLGWLRTDVSNGEQQKYLEEFLADTLSDPVYEGLNPYLTNAHLLVRLLAEETPGRTQEGVRGFDVGGFVAYLLDQVYFVVIETHASLLKTLQIFNTINTAGLDLSGADIFKIRFYEYLRELKKRGPEVFPEISGLYEQIDARNRSANRNVSNIDEVLGAYQHVLIARSGLPVQLHASTPDAFFERLFDVALGVNAWELYAKAAEVDPSVGDLKRLIEARYRWEDFYRASEGETRCAMEFVYRSRYGRYRVFPWLFLFVYGDAQLAEQFLRQLAKLLIVYSVLYEKAVYDVSYHFWADLAACMFHDRADAEAVIRKVNEKLKSARDDLREVFATKYWAWIPKAKYLLSRLSAMLEEEQVAREANDDNLVELLFWSDMDIEHIEAVNNEDGEKRQEIWDSWGQDLHGLGNLMLLERSINRSIGNACYKQKLLGYERSGLRIVKQHHDSYAVWDRQASRTRGERELEKLLAYLIPG